MDQAIAMGLLRHVLQLAGGFLMARGVVDSGAMELITGGVVSLATAAWYLAARRK